MPNWLESKIREILRITESIFRIYGLFITITIPLNLINEFRSDWLINFKLQMKE